MRADTDLGNLLCCPGCRGSLVLRATERSSGWIETGSLICEACSRVYPVVRGVPRFVDDDENRDAENRE